MYLEFYNLKTEPFQITPDPEFLYLSPSHREALATITYAVEQGKGFMALVGEVGLGKTTLLQAFLQERPGAKEKVIYLFNSRLSYAGLLRALARELDLEPVSEDPEALLQDIYQALIREYSGGNNVILLIDEAQGLREETLEGLRLISNLETSTEKLLQIVLVGQPELAAKLNRYELRQLKQRIAVQAVLSPLTRKESREYLRFRLEKAGGRAEEIFTPRALEKIVRRARGIPRALNILADNALVTGFGYQQKPVTVKVVREVIADLGAGGGRFSAASSRRPPWPPCCCAGGLGVSVYIITLPFPGRRSPLPCQRRTRPAAARPSKGLTKGKSPSQAGHGEEPGRPPRKSDAGTRAGAPVNRKRRSPGPGTRPAAAKERPEPGSPSPGRSGQAKTSTA